MLPIASMCCLLFCEMLKVLILYFALGATTILLQDLAFGRRSRLFTSLELRIKEKEWGLQNRLVNGTRQGLEGVFLVQSSVF